MSLDQPLSSRTEQFLAEAVANGLFPSKAAAIDAAVEALRGNVHVLRRGTATVHFVPDEHMEAVEAAIEESEQGLSTPMTAADWNALRQRAHETASRRQVHEG